jgi:hypothetical protein
LISDKGGTVQGERLGTQVNEKDITSETKQERKRDTVALVLAFEWEVVQFKTRVEKDSVDVVDGSERKVERINLDQGPRSLHIGFKKGWRNAIEATS